MGALLETLVPFLINALRVMMYVHMGKIVVGLLGFLGIDMVVQHYVVGPLLDGVRAMMQTGPTSAGEVGVYMINWMGILRLDQAVSMVISAWTMIQTIKQGKMILGKVTS